MEKKSMKTMLDEWITHNNVIDDFEKEHHKPCVAIRQANGFMVIENPHLISGKTESNGDLIQLKLKIDFFKDELMEDKKIYEQIGGF